MHQAAWQPNHSSSWSWSKGRDRCVEGWAKGQRRKEISLLDPRRQARESGKSKSTEERGKKCENEADEKGEMGTKTVRRKPCRSNRQQTENMQSCGSREHRRFDRGGERNGIWLLPVVNPHFNTHTHSHTTPTDSLRHLRNEASRWQTCLHVCPNTGGATKGRPPSFLCGAYAGCSFKAWENWAAGSMLDRHLPHNTNSCTRRKR